jgi:hypothetical protein
MSIHKIRFNDRCNEHELYLDTNRFRSRVRVPSKKLAQFFYRPKVLRRALLAVRITDVKSFWMPISGNAEGACLSTTATTTAAAASLTTSATATAAAAAATSNVAPVLATASTIVASNVVAPAAG